MEKVIEESLYNIGTVINFYYDNYWSLRGNYVEALGNINITVASETDLNNLKYLESKQNSIENMDYYIRRYLDSINKLAIDIKEFSELLDEIESPKDKYLVIKIIKERISRFKVLYDELSTEIDNLSYEDKNLEKFLYKVLTEIIRIYDYLKEIY